MYCPELTQTIKGCNCTSSRGTCTLVKLGNVSRISLYRMWRSQAQTYFGLVSQPLLHYATVQTFQSDVQSSSQSATTCLNTYFETL